MAQALRAERVAAWRERADRWLAEQPQGRLFTADDLVAAIDKPFPAGGPAENNAIGGWINAQARGRRIEFTGRLSTSRRVQGHGNLQRLWRVKDARASSSDPSQRVEAVTTSEARGGWDEPRHPQVDAATAPTASQCGAAAIAEDVRAEARRLEQLREGDPGSALNAAPEPGWLLAGLKADYPELFTEAA
jgi:hypothetical protein